MQSESKFRMPAEWEPQAAMWLSWPHNVETWPQNLEAAQQEFVAFVRTISETQPVRLLCNANDRKLIQSKLLPHANLELINIETNDAWTRDYAPTFVKNDQTGQLVAVNWHYNAWGGKYPPYDLDQKVAQQIADWLGIPSESTSLCIEGGAIEINSTGCLLSTRSCALDPNRNQDRSLTEIETTLRHHLGAEKIVWLPGDAIEGDDTDGHIDQLARFTDNDTIVYAWCDDRADPQHPGLAKNLDQLKKQAPEFKLIALPLPRPIKIEDRRIPASYCNFLITNSTVIVPQFGYRSTDEQALTILNSCFPDRKIIGLPSLNLAVGLGSFHCLSQQQPV